MGVHPKGLSGMSDFVAGMLTFIFRALYAVLEIFVTIDRLHRAARVVTGSDRLVDVPPEPKPPSPAAQRSLAEAKARRGTPD
jgi:hypothetical protein